MPRMHLQQCIDSMNEHAGVEVKRNDHMGAAHWLLVVLFVLLVLSQLHLAVTAPEKLLDFKSTEPASPETPPVATSTPIAENTTTVAHTDTNHTTTSARWPAQKLNIDPSSPPPTTPPSSPAGTPPSTPRGTR